MLRRSRSKATTFLKRFADVYSLGHVPIAETYQYRKMALVMRLEIGHFLELG